MFRALTSPSSGGQIVLSQHLVSSLSANGCTVQRVTTPDAVQYAILYCTVQRVTIPNGVQYTMPYCTVLYREWRYQMLYSMPYCTVLYIEWRYQMLYSMPYCTVQRVTIPDAVVIQFVLLKMGMLMLETCRGL